MKQLALAIPIMGAIFIGACTSTQARSPKTVEQTISHRLTGAGKVPAISASHGDQIVFHIVDTNDACFSYNTEADTTPRPEAARRGKTTVDLLPITHDEATTKYIINVKKRQGCPDTAGLEEVAWEIPVRELWNLAFAGGVARHDLVDPRFYLRSGTKDTDGKADTAEVPGFYISRNSEADDDFKMEGAGLSHLYLSSTLLSGVSVAPLSFGISISDDRPSYLLGSSLRFGSRAFLTFGRIFGSRQRLPTALHVDDFTTDANALADLPTRASESWFVGISYSFLSSGVADLFKSRVGVPQAPKAAPANPVTPTPPPQPQDASTPGTFKLDPTTAKNPSEKITATGAGFGKGEAGSELFIGPAPGIASTNPSVIKSWADEKIEFVVPADKFSDVPQTVTVEVKVGASTKGKGDLTIAKKADPPALVISPATISKAKGTITITGTGFGDRGKKSGLTIGNPAVSSISLPSSNKTAIPVWTDTKVELPLPSNFVPAATPLTLTVQMTVAGASHGQADLILKKE